jgi:hypothetical protein
LHLLAAEWRDPVVAVFEPGWGQAPRWDGIARSVPGDGREPVTEAHPVATDRDRERRPWEATAELVERAGESR